MNIFYTDPNPVTAAQSLPDRHIVKMPVEAVQMLVSACLRNGVQPNVVTKAGTILVVIIAPLHRLGSDSAENAQWLWDWGMALCENTPSVMARFTLLRVNSLLLLTQFTTTSLLPVTAPAQAMPDECNTPTPSLLM